MPLSPSPLLLRLLVLLSLSPCALVAPAAGQIESFEKQALSSAQEMSASDLDAALPDRPFASWFSEVIGPKAGVVWQLTECGEQIAARVRRGKTARLRGSQRQLAGRTQSIRRNQCRDFQKRAGREASFLPRSH